jgi:hypothetical protein
MALFGVFLIRKINTKMVLNTLNTITDDILSLANNAVVTSGEQLSRTQIHTWIHQYRALLIKQDIDKGRDINPQYVQHLKARVVPVDHRSHEHKADIVLPKLIDLHYGIGLVYVKEHDGKPIQISTATRGYYQQHRAYGKGLYIAFVRGDTVYLICSDELTHVHIGVLAENPADVFECFNPDAEYPMPINMIPTLKEMIFAKEIAVMQAASQQKGIKIDGEPV